MLDAGDESANTTRFESKGLPPRQLGIDAEHFWAGGGIYIGIVPLFKGFDGELLPPRFIDSDGPSGGACRWRHFLQSQGVVRHRHDMGHVSFSWNARQCVGRRALAEGPRPRRCAQTDGRGVTGEVGGGGGRTHAGGGGVGVVTGPRGVRTTLESGRVVLGCRERAGVFWIFR